MYLPKNQFLCLCKPRIIRRYFLTLEAAGAQNATLSTAPYPTRNLVAVLWILKQGDRELLFQRNRAFFHASKCKKKVMPHKNRKNLKIMLEMETVILMKCFNILLGLLALFLLQIAIVKK